MPILDLILAGVRRDADTSPAADGATHSLFTNAIGRLKTSIMTAAIGAVSGNITSAASVIAADVSRVSNVTVEINAGSFAGVSVIFETSLDGVNWKAERGARSDASNVTESVAGPLGAAPAYRWEFSVNGMVGFRVRATAWTSGSAPVVIGMGALPSEPFVTVPTHAVTGSGNFAVTMAAGATSSPVKLEDAAHASGDAGVFVLGLRNDNAVGSPTSADGDYSPVAVDANGAVFVRQKPAGTSAITSVASSASNVTLLAASTARRGATIYNDSTAVLYVKLGATASTSSFTAALAPKDANGIGGYYEIPFDYSGIIDGIWASANGNARVTAVS